jgi:hypothetical protein
MAEKFELLPSLTTVTTENAPISKFGGYSEEELDSRGIDILLILHSTVDNPKNPEDTNVETVDANAVENLVHPRDSSIGVRDDRRKDILRSIIDFTKFTVSNSPRIQIFVITREISISSKFRFWAETLPSSQAKRVDAILMSDSKSEEILASVMGAAKETRLRRAGVCSSTTSCQRRRCWRCRKSG